MEHNLYTQWVQQPQLLSDQHESRTQSLVDDWTKDRSTPNVQSSAAAADTPLAAGTTLDISDFTTLADLGASTTSSSSPSSLTSPTQAFFSPYQHSYFVQSPYNTLAYGSTWPSTSPVPLSNYSSLNGATTSTTAAASSSQHSPDQQQSSKPSSQSSPQPMQMHSPQQSLMIDPALTTLNGSHTTTNLQHYPQANYSTQSSQQQSQQQQPPQQSSSLSQQPFPYSHLLSYRNSPYFQPQSQQQQQQQQQQQGITPQALHAPSSSMLSALNPLSFYAHTTQALSQPQQSQLQSQSAPQPIKPTLTPQERKAQFQAALRPMLQSSAFTGAQAVNVLVDRILDFGVTEVDAATRLEILTKMRDGAGNHYFRAWSENTSAIDVTRDWLKAGYTAPEDSPLVETIMPLLHILDRLPMTVGSLKASKLGKIVVKLVKETPSPAIKDMASNVERKWRTLVSSAEAPSNSKSIDVEDIKPKKRKLSEPTSKPPPKKLALGTSASSKPTNSVVVKKEPSSSTVMTASTATSTAKAPSTAVKDAKSDSSFFSAPKPKPKLPSFKKAPPQPLGAAKNAGAGGANVAQPSSINPFEEVLKSMGKGRKESPVVATPPSTGTGGTNSATPPLQLHLQQQRGASMPSSSTTGLTKKGTKKKTVTWAPQATLESIRLIERAVYDDDPVDGIHTSHNIRDLDRGEGAALHAHLFEETVDWSEPLLIEMPNDIELRPRGEESEEKVTQETREQTALGALYMLPAHIPDSPAEPTHVISEEEVDRNIQGMTAGPEVDAVFWSSPAPVSPVAQSVAELVGQLADGGTMNVDPAFRGTQFNGQGLDLAAVGLDASATLAAVQALPQEHIQRLLLQLQQTQPGGGMFGATPSGFSIGPDQNHGNGWSGGMPNYSAEFGQGFPNLEESDRAWGRGRGKGRGRGRGGRGDFGYRENTRRPCSFFAAGRCKYGDQCDFSHDVFP